MYVEKFLSLTALSHEGDGIKEEKATEKECSVMAGKVFEVCRFCVRIKISGRKSESDMYRIRDLTDV